RAVCAFCQQAGYTAVPVPPAPVAPAWTSTAAPRSPSGSAGAAVLALAGIAVVLLLIVGLVSLRRPGAPARVTEASGGPSLVMLQPGGGGGASVLGAPSIDRGQIDQRLLTSAATTGGDVEVSLAWNSLSDLDLQVRDPTGELVSAHNARSRSGGVQDVDANPTPMNAEGSRREAAGQIPGAENVLPIKEALVDLDEQFSALRDIPGFSARRGLEGQAPSRYTRTPVEHIYYAHAPKGTYTVYAHCYSWAESSAAPLTFTVQVRSRGQVVHEASGWLGPMSYVSHGTVPMQAC
ncbi:MAG TPA: hypothetical protein VK689_04455, partial [Armatimonadota bacterium]|nr:hypothetical protein [Armatimonadota bacterium]